MWNFAGEFEAGNKGNPAFPTMGTPEEQWKHLLGYALMAPSAHNTQPWRFKIVGDCLELFVDHTRSLPTIDPDDRELTISCGAALYHLRVALRHFGYGDTVWDFPDRHSPDLLARVRLVTSESNAAEDERLFKSIPKRHTNRMSFNDERIPDETLHAVESAAFDEGAWVCAIPQGDTRDRLAALISEADRDQLADPRYRHEISRWIRPNHDRGHDGVPGHVLGMPGLIADVGPALIRTFDTGPLFAARDRQLTLGAPTLIVLGTDLDGPEDWLNAGQALANMLLCATAYGISASFLNSPLELPRLRAKVRDLLSASGYPQIIIRMGYGPEIEPTPRRTPDEVLMSSSASPD